MSTSGTGAAIDHWLALQLRDVHGTTLAGPLFAGSHLASLVRRFDCSDAPDTGIVRLIALLAALAAVVIAAVIPASYFLVAQARLRGEIEVGAQLYAADVTEAAQQIPGCGMRWPGAHVTQGWTVSASVIALQRTQRMPHWTAGECSR